MRGIMKKITFIVIILLIVAFKSYAQQPPEQPSIQIPNILPPSPTAAAFARYGDIPVDISTGVPDIEIPLYTVTSRTLSVPLVLSYHASGIKVNDISTPVGLGWVLKGMGVVSRTILDRADEETTRLGTLMGGKATYISKANYDSALNTMTNYSTNYNVGYALYNDMKYHDKQADRFNYQLPNGKCGVFRYDFTTHDFSPQHCIVAPYSPLIIVWNNGGANIKDENGINYYFSKGYGTEQVLNPSSNYYNEASGSGEPLTSWYLTSMSTADGSDEIDYEYADETNNDTIAYYTQSVSWGLVALDQVGHLIPQNPTNIVDGGQANLVATHDPMLTKITTATTIVTFQYIKDRKDWINNSRLVSIKIYDKLNNNLIKEIDLNNNDYFGHTETVGSPRLKLNSVTIRGEDTSLAETYSFGYNGGALPPYINRTNFPGHNISSIANFSQDYWGYYNGATNAGLIPVEYYSNYWAYGTYPGRFGGNRRPDPLYGSTCMLNSITYPTGGTTNFTFESNYSNDIYQKISGDGSYAGNVGGFRIKKITSSDKNGNTITKTYEYPVGGVVPHPLTGSLFAYTQQYIGGDWTSCDVLPPSSGYDYTLSRGTIQSSSFSPLSYTNGSIIVYPNVTVYEGGGKTDYTYQIPEEYPTNEINNLPDPQDINWSNIYGQYFYDNGYYQPQLLNKYIYKIENGQYKLIGRTDNTYQYFRDADFSTGVNVVQTCYPIDNNGNYFEYEYEYGESCPSKSINKYPNFFSYVDTKVAQRISLLTKSVETDYDPGGNNLITSKTYQYADTVNLLPTRISTVTSTGDSLVSIYTYASDDKSGVPGVSTLNYYHILTPVIEAKNYKNNTFLNSLKKEYRTSFPLAPADVISTVGSNAPEMRLVFNAYDQYGNITDVSKYNSKVHDLYVYGYNSALPVAKIEHSQTVASNQALSIISSNLNQSILNNPASDDALRTELNKLYTLFPKDLISTYTYKPLVGMTSETVSNGDVTYYQYDGLGRLQLAKDKDQKILRAYAYNYLTNSPSSIFGIYYSRLQTKNINKSNGSCSVQVTIPAGKFSSTISQAVADQLAINDLNTNGQQMANSLPCTYYNEARSQSFPRNNCGIGYNTSPVTYYVPANKYVSHISLADANQLAQHEIDSLGQAYANQSGICYPDGIYATLSLENLHTDTTAGTQSGEVIIHNYEDVVLHYYKDFACTIPLTTTINLVQALLKTTYDENAGVAGTEIVNIPVNADLSQSNAVTVLRSALVNTWTFLNGSQYINTQIYFTVQ